MQRADPLVEELLLQERAWDRNGVLRELYGAWYREIASQLAPVPGPTVELGSGMGKFREVVPEAVLTDVQPTPWVDAAVDAERLPYDDSSIANLVLVDVLHHVPHPTRFLDEAQRCLAVGGRAVLLEPYCSPLSYPLFRAFHHERTSLGVDPFDEGELSTREALDSNQALPTLLFFKQAERTRTRWPRLVFVERRRLALLAYPLSGGWRRRPLLSPALLRPTLALERLLAPVAPLLAFRCLIVLERVSSHASPQLERRRRA